MAAALVQGFADPVLDAQRVFRAVLMALAEPGRLNRLPGIAHAPAPLSPVLAALALTLLDHETPVFLDKGLAESLAVKSWLAFQCGAAITHDPGTALFALVADPAALPPLALFAQGSDSFPDRSTTILIAATPTRQSLILSGPGIETTLRADLPIRPSLFVEWADNRSRFPRGVDVVIAGKDEIIGLPRTTRLARA